MMQSHHIARIPLLPFLLASGSQMQQQQRLPKSKLSCRADSPSWTRFLGQAEAAKVGLSRAPAVAIDLGGLQVPSQQVQLTQEDLEEATWGLRKRLWAPLARMGLRSCIHWHLWWVAFCRGCLHSVRLTSLASSWLSCSTMEVCQALAVYLHVKSRARPS